MIGLKSYRLQTASACPIRSSAPRLSGQPNSKCRNKAFGRLVSSLHRSRLPALAFPLRATEMIKSKLPLSVCAALPANNDGAGRTLRVRFVRRNRQYQVTPPEFNMAFILASPHRTGKPFLGYRSSLC
eukprot:1058018-Pelagomonas_calceolata.AAC.9